MADLLASKARSISWEWSKGAAVRDVSCRNASVPLDGSSLRCALVLGEKHPSHRPASVRTKMVRNFDAAHHFGAQCRLSEEPTYVKQ